MNGKRKKVGKDGGTVALLPSLVVSLASLSIILLLLRCPAPAGFTLGKSCCACFTGAVAKFVAGFGAVPTAGVVGGGAGVSFATGGLVSVEEEDQRRHIL